MLREDGNIVMVNATTVNIPNTKQYRIISSVYPPINFFEDLVDPSEMQAVWEVESITNDRLRQEAGDINLVISEDRIAGHGSSILMAAFTHLSGSTRFSDGSYGIYYAGLSKETAIRETVFHRENFLRATNEDKGELTMRLYEGTIERKLHDIRGKHFAQLHNPHDYSQSQSYGRQLKDQNSWGIIYNSVRHDGGDCIAALRPPAVSIPIQSTHLRYIWNGERITEVLDTNTVLRL